MEEHRESLLIAKPKTASSDASDRRSTGKTAAVIEQEQRDLAAAKALSLASDTAAPVAATTNCKQIAATTNRKQIAAPTDRKQVDTTIINT